MRTTFQPKTISFCQDNIWSPEMSFEQFEKIAHDIKNISSIVVNEIITKEKLAEIYPELYKKYVKA